MAKLVEYPPPPSPPLIGEERWFADGEFLFYQFTSSEVSASGFYGLASEAECEGELFEKTCETGTRLQQLVFKAFNTHLSGAIRALWLDDVLRDEQFADTDLTRFPPAIADGVREMLLEVGSGPEDQYCDFVQCVAMLHAYTGLPSGEKSEDELARDARLFRDSPVGEALDRITLGPWARPLRPPGGNHP